MGSVNHSKMLHPTAANVKNLFEDGLCKMFNGLCCTQDGLCSLEHCYVGFTNLI